MLFVSHSLCSPPSTPPFTHTHSHLRVLAQHFTNIRKTITWLDQPDNCTTSQDFTMLCFSSVDTLATGSKAVGGSLQRYHSVAFTVSRSVSRDLSWHGIGLDEPHQSLKCKKMFYDLTCVVKSRRKYALSQYQVFWSKKGTQERIKKQNNKTEGKKGEVENSLSFEATKWEKEKNIT